MWISCTADQLAGFETPCFVLDEGVLRERVRLLRASDAKLLCAVKANPHPRVLELLRPLLDGADVASEGELDAALKAGFAGESLSVAGPGKSRALLERAVAVGATLNVESLREVRLLASLGVDVTVRLRVNATKTFRAYRVPMTGVPSPFGFDEEALDEVLQVVRASPRLRIRGVHLHPGAQCTSVAGVLEAAATGLDLLQRVGGTSLNLGGGFGAVAPGKELDVAALAPKLAALRAKFGTVEFTLEPGRWLVGPAGLYVTRVLGEKRSRGVHFTVVDGGVHHLLAASTALMPKTAARAPVLNLTRPDAPLAKRTLTGVLCTPLDTLGEDVELPTPQEGDLLAFQGAGAYGPSFSPLEFLSHARPVTHFLGG